MSDPVPTYHELAQRWKALRATHDIVVREVACVGAPRTLLCVERGETTRACIHLSAGVHGDEPAGVLALLALVERRMLDDLFSYRIWPCTNPTGSSPEAKAIIMANRDRKFALAIDLHEDDEADGPYCFEYGERLLGTELFDSCLRPDPVSEAEALDGLSLSLLLRRGAAEHVLTFESASARPLEERIAVHATAVQRAIALMRQEYEPSQGFVK